MNWYSFLAFLLALSVSVNQCSKPKEAEIPACIQSKIDSIKSQAKWNPPAQVTQYTYQHKTVYLLSSPCCDQYNILVDKDCNYICAPTGGFSGKGDGRCTDFETNATLVKVVWKDNR
jgi:hypothetical protein